MRRYPGDILEGRLLTSFRTGQAYPPLTRCNRVRVYLRREIEREKGLTKGELLAIYACSEYDLSRQGYWLVLEYFLGAARYRVLHTDAAGKLHDVLINVGDIEDDDCFRTAKRMKRS